MAVVVSCHHRTTSSVLPLPLVPLLPLRSLHRSLRRAGDAVARWPVESQLTARRNAMVAATALAQLRAEREDVEDFLSALDAPATGRPELRASAH